MKTVLGHVCEKDAAGRPSNTAFWPIAIIAPQQIPTAGEP
jgi:hypothetical protein